MNCIQHVMHAPQAYVTFRQKARLLRGLLPEQSHSARLFGGQRSQYGDVHRRTCHSYETSSVTVKETTMKLKSGKSATSMSRTIPALALSTLLAATGCTANPGESDAAGATQDQEQPNIMMILLDDLGYTDLGVYGGEVETPNLDALAHDSAQFTDFYTEPVCAPTRAALMTGQDRHRVGLGSMEGITPPGVPESTPGYKGSLEGDYTGIAEILGDEGYETYQVGKWHLGGEDGQTPEDLGFDENFTIYDGAASYFSDAYRHSPRDVDPVDTAIYERNGEV